MYENHDLSQHFVRCMIQFDEKTKVVIDSMEPNGFDW